MLHGLVRAASGAALRLFYRIELGGAPLPDSRPVLLVGNHPNGLVDPALLVALSTRWSSASPTGSPSGFAR